MLAIFLLLLQGPPAVPGPPTVPGFVWKAPKHPWPEALPFPKGLKRYRRAVNTQSIYVLVGHGDRIDRVPRTRLERKWNVPGGMLGVEGWQSDLYRVVPGAPQVWVGNIAVLNSSGYFQANRGYRRSYPAGTVFADVLSSKGRVFEVRYAEKRANGWERYVAFKDASARPAGYQGLQGQRCASCHSEAGTGAYGAGLVPGGDGVISDPFQELE